MPGEQQASKEIESRSNGKGSAGPGGKIQPKYLTNKLVPATSSSVDKLLNPPSDSTICALYIAPTPMQTVPSDIKTVFYMYGPITNVMVRRQMGCTFVVFQRREDAEMAAKAVAEGKANSTVPGQVKIRGEECRVEWAKDRAYLAPRSTK